MAFVGHMISCKTLYLIFMAPVNVIIASEQTWLFCSPNNDWYVNRWNENSMLQQHILHGSYAGVSIVFPLLALLQRIWFSNVDIAPVVDGTHPMVVLF